MQSSKKVLIALLVAVIIILLVVLEYLIFQHKTPAPAPIPATLATTTQKVVSATDSAAIAYWVLQNDLNQHGGPACYDVNNTSDGTIITYSFTKEYNNTNCPYDPNATTTIPLIEVNIKTGAAYTQEANGQYEPATSIAPVSGAVNLIGKWQVYTNSDFGYTMQVPLGWTMSPEQGSTDGVNVSSLVYLSDASKAHSVFVQVSPGTWVPPVGSKTQNLIIAGQPVVAYFSTATSSALCRDTDCSFMRIQINHNDNWYGIGALGDIANYTDIYENILSTFQFLNGSVGLVNDAAGLYKDESDQFQFYYPRAWNAVTNPNLITFNEQVKPYTEAMDIEISHNVKLGVPLFTTISGLQVYAPASGNGYVVEVTNNEFLVFENPYLISDATLQLMAQTVMQPTQSVDQVKLSNLVQQIVNGVK